MRERQGEVCLLIYDDVISTIGLILFVHTVFLRVSFFLAQPQESFLLGIFHLISYNYLETEHLA